MDATFGSPGGAGGVRWGEWGPGKPSFWCMPDGSASGGHIQFLVQQENAGRIREEHPWCAGTAMSSMGGGGIAKPTAAAELAHFQPPPGVTVQVRKSGGRKRFEDERGELSPAGHERLLRGFESLIVWRLAFRCVGIDTYVCVQHLKASYHSAPGSEKMLGFVPEHATVVALARKVTPDQSTWIQIDRGWLCVVRVTSAGLRDVIFRAAGCEQQCGGTCACSADCQMQGKKWHGCDFVVKLERTLGTVRDGLVRVTLSGRHATNSSAWAALPFEHRRPSPSIKRSIVKLMGVKSTARQAQLQLNLAAKGAEGVGPSSALERQWQIAARH
jgi:hypothetical protein